MDIVELEPGMDVYVTDVDQGLFGAECSIVEAKVITNKEANHVGWFISYKRDGKLYTYEHTIKSNVGFVKARVVRVEEVTVGDIIECDGMRGIIEHIDQKKMFVRWTNKHDNVRFSTDYRGKIDRAKIVGHFDIYNLEG